MCEINLIAVRIREKLEFIFRSFVMIVLKIISGFLFHSIVILAFTSENSTTNIFTANRKPFRYLYHISGKYLLQQEACGGLFALYID